MHNYQHILAAVDLTDGMAPLLNRAAEVARRYGSRVTLIHVVEVVPVDVSSEIVLPKLQEVQNALTQRAQTIMRTAADEADLRHADIVVRTGGAKWEVITYASENAVDLIIMGGHTPRGLRRLLGSTANAVLSGAPCDVLVVHLPDAKK